MNIAKDFSVVLSPLSWWFVVGTNAGGGRPDGRTDEPDVDILVAVEVHLLA